MHSRWLLSIGLVLIVGVVVTRATTAHADPQREAEQEMELAQDALDHNDYPAALQHFSSAQTLAPQASGPLLGLGLTYAAIDRCQEAVPLLEEYRRRKGAAANPKAERAIADCKSRPGTGKLILETRPTEVDVFRDIKGQPSLGRTPLVVDLPVGRHTLLLKKRGYFMSTVTVRIRSGQETRELAGLRAESSDPDVETPPTTPRPPATVDRDPLVDSSATTTEKSSASKPSRTGLYVGLGVGIGLVLVIGITVGAVVGTQKKTTEFPLIAFPGN